MTLGEALHGSTRTITLNRSDPRTGQATSQTLRVKIPAGVREDQLIRLSGAAGFRGQNKGKTT